MDEEKQQNNGQAQNPASALSRGVKKAEKNARRKVFRKIIIAILPKLLLVCGIALIAYVLLSSISNYLDKWYSELFKNTTSSSISYSTGTAKINKININSKNVTTDGAYQLTYSFKNKQGNDCTEAEAIEMIKNELKEANEEIDLSKFTNSELKIIGSLIFNGLETEDYTEEQLKALAIFIKADIAGNSFDLRKDKNKDKKITVEELQDNDYVYGTIELHKTKPTSSGYEEITLEYVDYDTLKSMISSGNTEALEKYSLDNKGNIVIAKSNSSTITYTYKNASGGTLSDADKARILETYVGEDEDNFTIKEYPLSIDYKQYIKKYIASYGLLNDLLLTTNNVDFSLEIAELALNSRIVLNIREEQVDMNTHHVMKYTETNMFRNYVTYTITGYKTGLTSVGTKVGTSTVDSVEESTDVFECFITIDSSSTNFKYDIDISEIDCWYLYYERPYAAPTENVKTYDPPDDIVGEFPNDWEVLNGTSGTARF